MERDAQGLAGDYGDLQPIRINNPEPDGLVVRLGIRQFQHINENRHHFLIAYVMTLHLGNALPLAIAVLTDYTLIIVVRKATHTRQGKEISVTILPSADGETFCIML